MKNKKSLKTILVSDSIKNISANLISLPISIISSLLIARILGPELTGITAATITLVLNYTIFAHLGTLNALSQHYPFLIGQGSIESIDEAKRMPGIILGFLFYGAVGISLIVFALAFWQLFFGSKLMALGFSFGLVVAVLQLYKTYYLFVIRATNQFQYWSRYTLQFAWVPIVWVVSAKLGGVMAQWISLAATELIMCLALYRSVGRDIKMVNDIKTSWQYIKLGFPIFFVGSLFGIFTTIDRLASAIFLGPIQLGYYGVASMAATFLGIIPGMIGQIMWPRMAEKSGEKGYKLSYIIPYIEKPTFLMSFLLPPLIGIVVLIIPTATKLLLPQYMAGVKAAQISIYTVYFLGLMGMYTIFLGTSLRLLPYGIVTVVGIILNLAGTYISVNMGWGLEGIAWTKVISYGVVAILIFLYVENLFNHKWKDIIIRLMIILFPMLFVYLMVVCILPWLFPNEAFSTSAILFKLFYQLTIMIMLSLTIIWFALYRSGLLKDFILIIQKRKYFHF